MGDPQKSRKMVKLLVLQYLYNLSDERVIEDASLNLAYMYFLDINPEDGLPHPSLLAKFSTGLQKQATLKALFNKRRLWGISLGSGER